MSSKSRNKIIRYTLEQEERHQLKANSAGLSFSEFIRQAGDNAEIFIKDETLILKAIEAVNRIGNNTNQMAKAANAANLSGKVSDDMYRQFILRLKLYTDEIKALGHVVKLNGNI